MELERFFSKLKITWNPFRRAGSLDDEADRPIQPRPVTVQHGVQISRPRDAISRCGTHLCKSLKFENNLLLAALVGAGILTESLGTDVLVNGYTTRDYKWGQLFNHLLR